MANEQPTHRQVVDSTAAVEATMSPQNVPVNVYETTGAVVIVAPMPAVTASDVTVELSTGTLRFWARLRSAAPREYLIHEWDYGGYEREIRIPEGHGSGIEASLVNGQLVVRILRGEPAGPLSVQPTAATA
jgi:HSP20 family molecular chaperone IbpA